jgi:membrane-bound lytic murein transglycosylase A
MVHQTMKTKINSAPSASSKSNHMRRAYLLAALMQALLLASCGWLSPPVSLEPSAPPGSAATTTTTIEQRGARWVGAAWSDLPGWASDRPLEAWRALRRSCERIAPEMQRAWATVCADALRTQPADDLAARAWFELRLTPYRVLPRDNAASGEGLATGYFEPLVEASRVPRGAQRHAFHAPPADLATKKPWFTRAQMDSLPAAQAALRGREIAYTADPLDVLILQIQGSGRARITEADGRVQTVRLAFAGHNDQGYVSVGRWLIDQGELKPGEASWPGIREWARKNPQRAPQMLHANPRVVFFREEPLTDATQGPRGSQGVALTPERSIAVDPAAIPLGTPVWLDTTEPLTSTPLRRLVMAQDTGSAITGAVRADYFWGWGERAEAQAGRMKQPLRLWVLWPK